MLFDSILLALSSSIDAVGVGITYGLKKTKIHCSSLLILFVISAFFTYSSVILGNLICAIISPNISKVIGALFLIGSGSFLFYESLFTKNIKGKKEKKERKGKEKKQKHKEYSFFIQFLGITINIIKDPINSDLDNSKIIDIKEAVFLGLALSLDSISIGIGASIALITDITFPLFISIFQIVFLIFGKFIGEKISNISKLPNNIWNILSGLILIFIGIMKLI